MYINDARSSKYEIMEIYLLIKYIKFVLRRVTKRLSYIEEARCLKVNETQALKMHGTLLEENRDA
jgi:hypothetical protein